MRVGVGCVGGELGGWYELGMSYSWVPLPLASVDVKQHERKEERQVA